MPRTTVRHLLVLLLLGLMSAGCGTDTLKIGVLTDEPGVAYQDPSTTVRSGFEISMYRWIATNTEPNFNYEEFDLTVGSREQALQRERVDVVVGSYSITDYRRTQIDFAGPYLISQQGVMIRSDGPLRDITQADQLAGKTVCAQRGSTSTDQLKSLAGGTVTVREFVGLKECVDALIRDDVDAVSTDQILLRGYAKDDSRLTVPDTVVFGTFENYGVGLPLGDHDACEEWSTRLQSFLSDPAWNQFYIESFGEPPPPGTKPQPNSLDPCPD